MLLSTWFQEYHRDSSHTRTCRGFSKVKEFADDNFKFDINGRKFVKQVENTVGNGEIARYEQFLLFPSVSKDLFCKNIETRACFGKR